MIEMTTHKMDSNINHSKSPNITWYH